MSTLKPGWVRSVSSVVLLVACACGVRGNPARAVPPQSGLSATIPAAHLTRVALRVQDGSLAVRPANTDEVIVTVSVSGDDCRRGPAAALLRTRDDGGALHLDVRPSTKGRCDEHWRIEMPVALMLEARGDRVDMDIRGTRGGLDLNVGKGTIEVDARAGNIEAVVQNGDVRVGTASTGYGRIRLATQVGRTELSLDGRAVRHPRPPGPGDWIEIGGPGQYRVSLRATVGSVRLDVGVTR